VTFAPRVVFFAVGFFLVGRAVDVHGLDLLLLYAGLGLCLVGTAG
jgi:hypothetical protein